jgi:hypothetical protein
MSNLGSSEQPKRSATRGFIPYNETIRVSAVGFYFLDILLLLYGTVICGIVMLNLPHNLPDDVAL